MVKCKVINQELTINKNFKKLQNIKRIKSDEEIIKPNHFDIGDVFETDEEYAKYLSGETKEQPIVCIKVLEIIPEKKEEKLVTKKIRKVKQN